MQIREKEKSTREYLSLVRKVHGLSQRYGIPLIIDDRLDITMAVDAEGVHLGRSDMPIDLARSILGENKIIGATTKTVEQGIPIAGICLRLIKKKLLASYVKPGHIQGLCLCGANLQGNLIIFIRGCPASRDIDSLRKGGELHRNPWNRCGRSPPAVPSAPFPDSPWPLCGRFRWPPPPPMFACGGACHELPPAHPHLH